MPRLQGQGVKSQPQLQDQGVHQTSKVSASSSQQGISIFKPKQEEANGLEAGSRNQTSLKSIGTMKALLL